MSYGSLISWPELIVCSAAKSSYVDVVLFSFKSFSTEFYFFFLMHKKYTAIATPTNTATETPTAIPIIIPVFEEEFDSIIESLLLLL